MLRLHGLEHVFLCFVVHPVPLRHGKRATIRMALIKVMLAETKVFDCAFSDIPRTAMYEYEIHISQAEGSPSLICAEVQLCDQAAIKSARKMAQGRPFEVWRGSDCIFELQSQSRITP